MNDEKTIRLDRMRYTKNTLSSGLALLAILFNVFFFISIYESDVGNYYYNILMSIEVAGIVITALLPVYTKLLRKINTSIIVEDNGALGEIDISGED